MVSGLLLDACSAHDPDKKAQEKMILHLLKVGADVNETDKNGVTPLHRAVRFRSPAAVRLLIKQGADVNCQDKKSWSTPLHRAVTNTGAPATKGKADEIGEIIQILLEGGADPKIKNRMGKMPIEYVKDARIRSLMEGKLDRLFAKSKNERKQTR